MARPDFNEVFFENVHVPRQNLLGALNGGWRVAHDHAGQRARHNALAMAARGFENSFDDLIDLCRRMGPVVDAAPHASASNWRNSISSCKLSSTRLPRFLHNPARRRAGPEGSISKLNWAINQRMTEFAMELEGPASQLMEESAYAVERTLAV